MNSPLKIAVVGCGVIGTEHLKTLRKEEHITLSAVCDKDPAILEAVSEEFSPVDCFDSADRLLSEGDFDAAVLALPTAYRRDLTRHFIEAGKHVLLEKPAGMNEKDILEFEALRSPDQIVASCSSRFSNSRALRQGREWIEAGEIGRVRLLRCRGLLAAKPVPDKPYPRWRIRHEINGGGILSNWGAYDLDFILSLSGWSFDPEDIKGRVFNVPAEVDGFHIPDSNVETHALCLAENSEGQLLHYERAETYPGDTNSCWEILGTKGSVSMDMLKAAQGVTLHQLDPEKGAVSKTVCFSEDKDYDLHRIPVSNFVAAIRGEAPPLTDLRKSALIARIIDGIYNSATNKE